MNCSLTGTNNRRFLTLSCSFLQHLHKQTVVQPEAVQVRREAAEPVGPSQRFKRCLADLANSTQMASLRVQEDRS
jgi:hypothetical protein